MSYDPLFPPTDTDGPTGQATAERPDENPAVAIIRAKVSRAYQQEPDALETLEEVKTERVLSKHQRFMQDLSNSGKSLAEIQTAWHHYYTTLSDPEKHEVWQEFYDANQHTPYQRLFQKQAGGQSAAAHAAPVYVPAPTAQSTGITVANHAPAVPAAPTKPGRSKGGNATTRAIKHKLADKISAGGKLKAKHHLQSLGFGLISGTVVLVLFLFTFFNEYIIAPLIQPSRTVSSTPIILGSSTVAADVPPSVTVPKINIQIPIDFSVNSYDEDIVQKGLSGGVVHYPNTALPGQNGNGAFFGHSSGNIFNNGKYKFAFTLLHNVTTGDLFYIAYGGKTYAYQVFDREIVPPTQVSVINDTKGKQATATLITCDPPGLNRNRLVIWGEQISPSPSTNTVPDQPAQPSSQPTQLTGNGPTLWRRFTDWVSFWD